MVETNNTVSQASVVSDSQRESILAAFASLGFLRSADFDTATENRKVCGEADHTAIARRAVHALEAWSKANAGKALASVFSAVESKIHELRGEAHTMRDDLAALPKSLQSATVRSLSADFTANPVAVWNPSEPSTVRVDLDSHIMPLFAAISDKKDNVAKLLTEKGYTVKLVKDSKWEKNRVYAVVFPIDAKSRTTEEQQAAE